MRALRRRTPRSRTSLRWKIAALAALTACLVAAAVGVLVHLWTAQDIRSRAEAQAFNTVYSAMDVYRRTGALAEGAELDPPGLPAALRAPADDDRHTAYDPAVHGNLGPSVWGAQRTAGPGSPVLAVRINTNPELHTLSRLDVTVTVASLVALAAAVPLAVYGAGLLGRRLRRVSETAGRISAGDLDARTGPTKGRDEVADIAAAVDLMADSLGRRLGIERQFTADVAHELRTPVGGLVAAVDLLPPGETEDLLRARVRDLRGLVEDLLEISRLDAGAEQPVRARVPLGAVVAEAVARTGHAAEVTVEGETTVEGEDTVHVETDPRRLERIVGNLVVNAHRHGAAPVSVTVGLAGRTVVVRDHGPGFPADLLRHGPRRFHTGARERGAGHGLGLTIAFGQARLLGAELRLDNAPDGGAVATLSLPPD
ncbi:signal transduction histidine kinase [Streptomyces sp. 1114.5]|uniref:sensor histidine kinase n=1 Tax=Streptomyces sp. 1114.5 TaxID=1938830 RepID=UPI000EADE670|nr:HAMP domain-containing sensor histidine kinase [Streptomyces sp. 1114.5]RKT09712.1 signal transduction histidine kinase [Streptomyces sp. 1114.5]